MPHPAAGGSLRHSVEPAGLRRRRLVLGGALVVACGEQAAAAGRPPGIQVWKDRDCGCCKDWVTLLEGAGFAVKVHDGGNTAARARLGMPPRYGACHTALVAGYVIEGHVPVADIRRLLDEKPKALGLAVPGMPVGSPGMDGAVYGNRRDPYQVLLVRPDGSAQIFNSYT